jgi:hypothetical protein
MILLFLPLLSYIVGTMNPESVEHFARFSRRSMFALLAVVLLTGGTGIALAFSPQGAVARSVARGAWFIPVAITMFIAVQCSMRGRRWSPDAPEVKAIMQDEWRRTNMDRAARLALIIVLLGQWPLALIVGFLFELPPPRTAMAMAASVTTLGLATMITLFLFFDRE